MQSEPYAIWIPGYWEYDYNKDQFYWVSGIWRRSPPGKFWLDGFWKQFSEGWVRIPGSWTPVTKQAITYLAAAPPETFEEDPLKPPENSFWVSGGWVFNNVIQDYSWRKGRWTSFDPKWIFVPATYVWREEGYVYIPAYWDWPLEIRGTVYQSVLIAPEDRHHIVYTPTEKVSATDLIQRLIYTNPDYLTLLTQCLYSHPEQKNKLIGIPSWWSWDPCTTFTWAHQWNLWWWFTHPLFPPPVWINIAHAQGILPPLPSYLKV